MGYRKRRQELPAAPAAEATGPPPPTPAMLRDWRYHVSLLQSTKAHHGGRVKELIEMVRRCRSRYPTHIPRSQPDPIQILP